MGIVSATASSLRYELSRKFTLGANAIVGGKAGRATTTTDFHKNISIPLKYELAPDSSVVHQIRCFLGEIPKFAFGLGELYN